MPYMGRRLRRRRSDEGAIFRVAVRVARVVLVILVSVAVGYAFYSALQWVAAEADRRGSGAALWAPTTAFAGEEQWTTDETG